ncbi:MAG: PEP-CTERM sorting domain-containing protein [Planctomycetia bacterium]|nr:PEP-CTERM sorting domain-containing protein [Planctomycetia bacterium]
MKYLVAGIGVLASLHLATVAKATSPRAYASIALGADLTSLDIHGTTQFKQFASNDLDDTDDADDKDVVASINETFLDAHANLSGAAHASIGDLGINFVGSVNTVPAAPPFGGPSSTTAYRVYGVTFWSDVLRLDLRNPGFFPTIINANLSIDGRFGYASGGQSPGSLRGTLYLDDLSKNSGFPATLPPSPFGQDTFGGVWGFTQQDPTTHINFDPPHLIPVTLVAVNGKDYEFVFEMVVLADAASGIGPLAVSGDFSGSLHWAGIESVTDEAGNPIPNDEWTLTSASGFDYTKPFQGPEPSSFLLLGMGGLAGLLASRRLKSARRRAVR